MNATGSAIGTDYIDIYFIHWPNIDLPLADAIGELEQLREAGNIRAIGVSNFMADELVEAGRYGRLDVMQPPYNLFWRFYEQAEAPYCREHSIGIMTYSSLAQGLLTRQLTTETEFPGLKWEHTDSLPLAHRNEGWE